MQLRAAIAIFLFLQLFDIKAYVRNNYLKFSIYANVQNKKIEVLFVTSYNADGKKFNH